MKEKIKEMLGSTDKEIQLLGLNYLGPKKYKKDICIAYDFYLKSDIIKVGDGKVSGITMERITAMIEGGIRFRKNLINLYVEYCYVEND